MTPKKSKSVDFETLVREHLDTMSEELDRRYTMREFAEECDVAHATLYHIMNGTKDPQSFTLTKIARALGVSKQKVVAAVDETFA